MIVYLYTTGLNESIPCIVTESRDDGTKRIKLLCDSVSGQYKAFENVHTLGENLTLCGDNPNLGKVYMHVINTVHTSYIMTGEIYELLGVIYTPSSHMTGESFTYKIRIHDGRIGSYRPECFKIIVG